MDVKNKKKVNKKLILGISLVILGILLIIIGYFIYISNQHSKSITSDDKYQLTSEYYGDVEDTVSTFNMFLIDKFPINDISKIDNKVKTKFLLDILNSKMGTELSTENVEKEKDKYFDTDVEIYLGIINDQKKKKIYEYNSKNKQFISTNNSYAEYLVSSKIINTKVNSHKLITKRKLYFTEKKATGSEYPKRIYKSISDFTKKQNEIFTITDANHLFTDEEYQKIKNKLKTYTYTFKKVNKTYKIESITIDEK